MNDKYLTKDELIYVLSCKGKTPNCIGKDCNVCRAELLYKYFNVKVKE